MEEKRTNFQYIRSLFKDQLIRGKVQARSQRGPEGSPSGLILCFPLLKEGVEVDCQDPNLNNF